jgi:adenosylhomocysteine nucleosidase
MRTLIALLACLLTFASARAEPVEATPRIAVLSAYEPEWKALQSAVEAPQVQSYKGVNVVLGRIEGKPVVLGLTGVSMVNAAMTTQMILDRYTVTRIVVTGVAGGVDPALNIGDVAVPERWGEYLDTIFARETPAGFHLPPWAERDFANFGMIFPQSVEVVRAGQDGPKPQFWFPVDEAMLAVARKAADGVALQNCTAATANVCLLHKPKVAVGGQGVSGPAFVDHAGFRAYVFDTFKAQVLDMETAAIGHVAATNNVPYIAFRSLSDLAGGGPGENQIEIFEQLAADNSVSVMRAFLKALPD